MKIFIILISIIITSCLAEEELKQTFEQWKTKFNSNIDESRKTFYEFNYEQNLKDIEAHNRLASSYTKGLNEFSHLPPEGFISTSCKTVLPDDILSFISHDIIDGKAADSVDWSSLMSEIQNQRNCGGCWAFAAMGFLEGMLNARNSSSTLLSPQYLIDCDGSQAGCEGGWPAEAFRYLKSTANGNVAPTSSDYPFLFQRMICNRFTPKIPLNITKITERFLNGNETALQIQVTNGPVIVAMFASRNLVQYKNFIYDDSACPTGPAACDSVNHAVVVVGFGTDPVYGDYWKVKNSWGTTFGEGGYFRIARNKGNVCNIACWSITAN